MELFLLISVTINLPITNIVIQYSLLRFRVLSLNFTSTVETLSYGFLIDYWFRTCGFWCFNTME